MNILHVCIANGNGRALILSVCGYVCVFHFLFLSLSFTHSPTLHMFLTWMNQKKQNSNENNVNGWYLIWSGHKYTRLGTFAYVCVRFVCACVGEQSFFIVVVVVGFRRVPRISHTKPDMMMEWKECYHKCTCSSWNVYIKC